MSLPEGGNQVGNNDNQNEIANENNALNNVAGDDRNQIQNEVNNTSFVEFDHLDDADADDLRIQRRDTVHADPDVNINRNPGGAGNAGQDPANDPLLHEFAVNEEAEEAAVQVEFNGLTLPDTREGLIQAYNADLYSDTLSFRRNTAYKAQMIKTLAESKRELTYPEGSVGKSYDIQIKALQNNWSVNDMDMMRDLSLIISTQEDEELKKAGEELLDRVGNITVNELVLRDGILEDIESYSRLLAEKGKELESSRLLAHVESTRTKPLHFTEFPEDEVVYDLANRQGYFDNLVEGLDNSNKKINKDMLQTDPKLNTVYSQIKGQKAIKNYKELEKKYLILGVEHNSLSFAEKQQIRGKGDYVMQRSNLVEQEGYNKNYVQSMAGINTSNRYAAKHVFGDNVYDGIDAVREQESQADRTVKMHNAKGNRTLLDGENVLEIDIAGSGLHLAERDYHGFAGNTYGGKDLRKWEDPIRLQYGARTPVRGFEDCHSIRKKETNIKVDGVDVNKTRFTIPGPMPSPVISAVHGLLDAGKYRIWNTQKMAQTIAEDYLTPLFDQWIKEKETNPGYEPKDVHINFSAYSRGAVSAGLSIHAIRDWVENHPRYNQFADKVKLDAVLYDPVPGPDGRLKGYGENDFRKNGKQDPNLNLTVFHSLSVNHSTFFDPQSVRGASRIIFGTTMHACTQDMIDNSQRGIVGDGKAHRTGYFDTRTGECYRGSGLSDLPKGIYFADEKQNLVRLTSYSQMPKLLRSLDLDNKSTGKSWKRFIPGTEAFARRLQNSRRDIICNSVKNYMLDNPLDISYESEHERAYEKKRFSKTVEEIGKDPANNMTRSEKAAFDQFREKLSQYEQMDKNQPNAKILRNTLIRESGELIRRDSGRSATSKRLENLSDIYSHLQRENVYDVQGLTRSKGRMELSEAAWKTQTEKAEARSENLDILKNEILDTKNKAKTILEKLEATRKDGSNSGLYNDMVESIRKVSEISLNKDSLEDISRALENMSKAAEKYSRERSTGLFHTRSEEGQKRITLADEAHKLGVEVGNEVYSNTLRFSQTDRSIEDLMEQQTVRINELKDIGKWLEDKKRLEEQTKFREREEARRRREAWLNEARENRNEVKVEEGSGTRYISLDSLRQKDGNKSPDPEKKAHKDLRIAPRADKENVKETEFKPGTI